MFFRVDLIMCFDILIFIFYSIQNTQKTLICEVYLSVDDNIPTAQLLSVNIPQYKTKKNQKTVQTGTK